MKETNTLEKLGKRVRVIRELRGMTQEELEEASGVNARYISALENGRKNATVELLERLSEGLQVPLLNLFSFDSEELAPSKKSIQKLLESMEPSAFSKAVKILKVLSD